MLVACTTNGAITFISPVYVGSISDVELTKVSGLCSKLEGKDLSQINVDLNIPPFLRGQQQLPASDVQECRSIASLRIHVERAIGRIKSYAILGGTFPLSMIRLLNQIVCVCGWLSNFQPALVPPQKSSEDIDETAVDQYFEDVTDSDYDGDESSSDD